MVFLTGGSGFLGKVILKKLEEANIETIIMLRKSKSLSTSNSIICDLEHINSLNLNRKTEVIIHSAALLKGKKGDILKTNYDGTKKIIDFAKKNRIPKIVFISSSEVLFGNNSYGLSKILAEKEIINSGLNWVIIRPSIIFGKGDNKHFELLLNLLRKHRYIPLPYKGKFCWEPVYVEDLSEFIKETAINNNFNKRILNIAGAEKLNFIEICKILSDFIKSNNAFIKISNFLTDILKLLYTIVFGKEKTEQRFMTFATKIFETNDNKIILKTGFKEFYQRGIN